LYDKVTLDLLSLHNKKKTIIQSEKNRIKEQDLKIQKHYDLEKIKPLCFFTYDFRDFKSSYFNIFAQDLLNNQIEVKG
jgi:hypothetical protein